MRKRVALEMLGTFFVVLTTMITGNENPIAIGLMIVVLLYIGRGIAQLHLNPAISFAVALMGRISYKRAAWLIVSQIWGGVLAGLSFSLIFSQEFVPAIVSDLSLLIALFFEALLTFLVCWVALLAATDKEIVHGCALVGVAYIAALSIGGLFNPAIITGAVLSSLLKGVMPQMTGAILIFFFAPFIGGGMAVLFDRYFGNHAH